MEVEQVHQFAEDINEWTNGIIFDEIRKSQAARSVDVSLLFEPSSSFTLFATPRGNQIKLLLQLQATCITTPSQTTSRTIVFTHGKEGYWSSLPLPSLLLSLLSLLFLLPLTSP